VRSVHIIIGHRVRCFGCGEVVRLVLIPTVGDRWKLCEDFVGAPDHIELHDCPKHEHKVEPAA
jgi:hypothetical protein